MLSSQQVSSMMMQQEQSFGAMNQHAQALSQSIRGEGFRYGMSDPYGVDTAQRHGGALVAGAGSGLSALHHGTALLGGFGLLGAGGAAWAMRTDPMMAAFGGINRGARMMSGVGAGSGFKNFFSAAHQAAQAGKAGRFVMGGLMGGAIAAAPIMAATSAVSYAGENIMAGIHQDNAIQATLGQGMDFHNTASRSGRGFSAVQRDYIADTMRGMAKADPMTDMAELTRLLDKTTKGGMFQGVTNAQDFGRKFSEMTKTLKEVAKVMGSSMEEALGFFESSKRMGFSSRTDIMNNARNAVTMAGGGLSSRGIMQTQAEGAQWARSMGYTMRSGAVLGAKTVQGVRDMFVGGHLSESDMIEMSGGQRGEQAYQTIGRQMQQAAYTLAQSGIGRATYAALAKTTGEGRNRRFTGEVDEGLMAQFRSGQLSASDVRKLAQDKLMNAGTDTKVSFLNQEQTLAGNFAAGAGAEGWMGVMNMVKSTRPGLSDEKVKLLLKQMTGLGQKQIDLLMKAFEKQDEVNYKNFMNARDALQRKMQEADTAENFTYQGIMRKVSHSLGGVGRMFQEAGSRMGRDARDFIQGMRDKLLGQRTTSAITDTGQGMSYDAWMGRGTGAGSFLSTAQATGSSAGATYNLRGGNLKNLFGMSRGADLRREIEGYDELFGGGKAAEGADIRGLMAGNALTGWMGMGSSHANVDMRMIREGGRLLEDTFQGRDRLLNNLTGDAARGLSSLRSTMAGMSTSDHLRFEGMSYHKRIRAMTDYASSKLKGTMGYESLVQAREAQIRSRFGTGELTGDRAAQLRSFAERSLIEGSAGKGDDATRALLSDGRQNEMFGYNYANLSDENLAKAREGAESQFATALEGNRRGLLSHIGSGMVLGGAVGSVAGPKGTFFGALAGGIGGALEYRSQGGATSSMIRRVMSDSSMRGDMIKAVGSDAEARKLLGKYEKGTEMRAVLENIAKLSPEERKARMADLTKIGGMSRSSELRSIMAQNRRLGMEIGSLDRGEVTSALGSEMASELLGSDPAKLGGLAGVLLSQDAKGMEEDMMAGRDRRQGPLQKLMESIGGMGRGQRLKAMSVLGKTAVGQHLLMGSRMYQKETSEKILGAFDSGSDNDTFFAKIKGATGIDATQQGEMYEKLRKDLLSARSTGDLGGAQKALTGAMFAAKKEDMSFQTQLKTTLDSINATNTKLLDVLIIANQDKLKPSSEYLKGAKARMADHTAVKPGPQNAKPQ